VLPLLRQYAAYFRAQRARQLQLVQRLQHRVGVARGGEIASGIAEPGVLDRVLRPQRLAHEPDQRARFLEPLACVVHPFVGRGLRVGELVSRADELLVHDAGDRCRHRLAVFDGVGHRVNSV
jgi:hypothetical protein